MRLTRVTHHTYSEIVCLVEEVPPKESQPYVYNNHSGFSYMDKYNEGRTSPTVIERYKVFAHYPVGDLPFTIFT